MNLPKVLSDLVSAQDNFDSVAYANCFSDSAIVYDEGKTHTGKSEIQHWIAEANEKYKAVMEPIAYEENGGEGILSVKVSGTFDGSPIALKYHFKINDGLIHSLKVTG
jgi:hypothetical protein